MFLDKTIQLFTYRSKGNWPDTVSIKGKHDVEYWQCKDTPNDYNYRVTKQYPMHDPDKGHVYIYFEFAQRTNQVQFKEGKDGMWTDLYPQLSQRVINHSPDGFNWGYGGSGPAQLALALCIELYGIMMATNIYQEFKRRFIASLETARAFEVTIDLNLFNKEVVSPKYEGVLQDVLRGFAQPLVYDIESEFYGDEVDSTPLDKL